jgi:hypothetical protein
MEMVLKGRIEGSDDFRKYFIRLYLKNKIIDNKNYIEFGHTWKKDLIKEKYCRILILIKGIFMPSSKEDYKIKDESEYIDYNY